MTRRSHTCKDFAEQLSKQKEGVLIKVGETTGESPAKEMAQGIRALGALPEVLGSIPSTGMVAQNHL